MKLRNYQEKATAAVWAHWSRGIRTVLLVAPTGSGKTEMGCSLVDGRVLWVAHRRELVYQAHARLAARFGRANVGVVLPGEHPRPGAEVQVGTVQSLLSRGSPEADVVVLDEAHHYLAETWRDLLGRYPTARYLGLTATPQRDDGSALGDIFEQMAVAAQHRELVSAGHLVPASVYAPPEDLGSDLALSLCEAWSRHGGERQAIGFTATVERANAEAAAFREIGVRAEVIWHGMSHGKRAMALDAFRRGRTRVLLGVDTLTEGVDLPMAEVIILGRSFRFVGAYLQAVGRGLRPAPGKTAATFLDLTGCTIRHGVPDVDREYSLDGAGIRQATGKAPPPRGDFLQEILGVDLSLVSGQPSPRSAPTSRGTPETEWKRLQSKHSPVEAALKFHRKFGRWPRIAGGAQ